MTTCRHCGERITFINEPHEWFGTDGYWVDPVDSPGYGPDYCWINLIDDHSAVGPHEPIEGEAK